MRLKVEIDGNFRNIYRERALDGKRAVTQSVKQASEGLQAAWRGQIQSAGLGVNLARTIRRQVYPVGGISLRAAALVWSNANKIIDAFDRGVTIRSANGFYLAIPLSSAGPKGRGKKRITPAIWEQKTGRRLAFIYRKGRNPLLVDTGEVHKVNYMTRKGEHKRRGPGRRNKMVPIFVLVPQARLQKRLNLDAASNVAQSRLSGLILSNWKEG